MANEPKTRPTGASVDEFMASVEPARRREDGQALITMMRRASGEPPEMWGPSIVGFGRSAMTYADGAVRDWPVIAFSPRKANLVLYLEHDYEAYPDLVARLGKHRTGASCLYINKLADVNTEVLGQMIAESVAHTLAADNA
jgi:hypothetical protein